ncbi:acyl-CoA dehydrogenase family member 9, mitochondrial-like [Orbicella faveolata]|uniref:acyl-CoA dehydrogenase family member 9, mitochondrial-like n=1 Tax=Orbicella faveolata TaxID=48498 RepID=UPI0009E19D25|nr:acyl-CoA dehydrogenase family member 9, mitochondrial-like [Orbicella faveolata]
MLSLKVGRQVLGACKLVNTPLLRCFLHTSKPTSTFAKDLFLGRCNKAKVFPFPDPLNEEQRETLTMLVEPVEKYFQEKVDSADIDKKAKIPEDVMGGLRDLGLFGLLIPEKYGGLGLLNTNYARVTEAFSDASIAVTLMAHQSIGLKGILLCGTEAQKQKYLPRLASGEHIAAFCLTEPSSGSDAASIQTRATLSDDGKHFLLNGSKIWISNGGWADVMTVFARTHITDAKGEQQDKITAFIVEREFGGVTSGKPEDKLGIRGSNTCELHFDNTPIPVENVLGDVGGGFKVAMNILNSGRFGIGAGAGGGLRRLIDAAAEHATSRKQFNRTLSEFGQIQEKFARMALKQYTIESMSYLTTGLLDCGEEDASVEAAMCKVYGSEGLWVGVNEALQILGGLGYMKDYPYERVMRDSRILMIFEGTNEILRMYIALTGMQHAGKQLQEMVKYIKNPFSNVEFMTEFLTKRALYALGLKENLQGIASVAHPQLAESVKRLEENIADFGRISEKLLSKFGKKIIEEQLLLKRMADVSINLYGMTAVISRATRSINQELPSAHHEALLVDTICKEKYHANNALFKEVKSGSTKNGDEELKKIAEEIFSKGGCVAPHTLNV